MFNAHINVEMCNSVKSIKYVCKYVNKGSDMAVLNIAKDNPGDEIVQFQTGRYINSNEAFWRIFGFSIHERYPAVIHLSVHLENAQRVYFTESNISRVVERPPNTTLTAFFDLCKSDAFAATLLYCEVPTYYTWNKSQKVFIRRKRGTSVPGHPNIFSTNTLTRVYTVHPNNIECFYLRLLLHHVRGPKCFTDLRTVFGHVCPTFQSSCEKLGLLELDTHWHQTLNDCALSRMPHHLRYLFALIVSIFSPSSPQLLWDTFRNELSEDILHDAQRINPSISYGNIIYNTALIIIEDLCLKMANKSLEQLGIDPPEREAFDARDREYQREKCYDTDLLTTFVNDNKPLLISNQEHAFNIVTKAH